MIRRIAVIIPLLSIIIVSLGLHAQILPSQFKLYQNALNPSQQNGVRILFDAPISCTVHLWIEDSAGVFQKDLVHSDQSAGRYSVFWNAKLNESTYVGPGLYYAKLLTSWDSQTFRDSIAMRFLYDPNVFSPFNIISFRDNEGFSAQRLYFGRADSSIDLARFEMPPAPPPDVFDVRYSSNRILELASYALSQEYPIDLTAVALPLTIRWDFFDSLSMKAYLKINGTYINMADVDSVIVDSIKSQLALRLDPVLFLGVRDRGNTALNYSLHQNYPNPFNPATNIAFEVPVGSFVSVKVYNLLGQEITTLVNEFLPAGHHHVAFYPGQLSSGVYYYRLQTGNFVSTRKMVLMR
jgi:hypothetical protein